MYIYILYIGFSSLFEQWGSPPPAPTKTQAFGVPKNWRRGFHAGGSDHFLPTYHLRVMENYTI